MWATRCASASPGSPTDDRERVFAIVATAGTTNAGVIDDLAGAADVCAETRRVVPRRRRLRRRRAGRAERARPLPRHRARRQLHRRSAQVAVRPVRLLRAGLPRPRRRPRPRTRSTPSTSTCCTATTTATTPSGTRATSPTTCRAGPAACRSGSASPRTAPTPTATPSRRRSTSPATAPRLIDAADHLELIMEPELSVVAVPAHRAGRRATTRRGATGCSPTARRSWCPTSWAGETVLRFCIVNPRTIDRRHPLLIDSLA